jgi:uncharacterized membrane protein HdeD (DUF308 family)
MLIFYGKKWWLFIIRGLLAIIFGALAVIWPELTLRTLILLFGVFVLIDGVFTVIIGLVSSGTNRRWWAELLIGLLDIAIGVLTIVWPEITGMVLLYFIAAWALINGVFGIIAAIQLRRVLTNEWVLILNSVLSIVIGVLFILFPSEGALSLIWLIGIFAIVFGILDIILGFRLRTFLKQAEDTVGIGR